MEDHDEKADELEREADDLEHQGDKVEEHIDDTRSDFEGKLGDQQAPGLLEEDAAAPGGSGEDD
jgi:chaperonin cofactor prefoldin